MTPPDWRALAEEWEEADRWSLEAYLAETESPWAPRMAEARKARVRPHRFADWNRRPRHPDTRPQSYPMPTWAALRARLAARA